jgi:hypothetical protein
VKETEKLRDKNSHIESELKIAYHKIEKMEILSEKAERLQVKKEVEMMREIEDRVRKEIKNTLAPSLPLAQGGTQSAGNTVNNIYHSRQSSVSPSSNSNSQAELTSPPLLDPQGEYKRGSILVEESPSNSARSDFMRGISCLSGGLS